MFAASPFTIMESTEMRRAAGGSPPNLCGGHRLYDYIVIFAIDVVSNYFAEWLLTWEQYGIVLG